MLQINSVNLETIAETKQPNDTRLDTDWTINDHRFIVPVNLFDISTITTDFKQNGNPWTVASKGTRPYITPKTEKPPYTENPSFAPEGAGLDWITRYSEEIDRYNYRFKEINPGQYYLIKFSDKTLRWCTTQVSWDTTPPADSIIIGTASEDLKVVLIELVGGGGGGEDGGVWACGTGGAGGGYVFAALKVEHEAIEQLPKNTFPIAIGAGGLGNNHNGRQQTAGGASGFYFSATCAFEIPGGGHGGDGVVNYPGQPKEFRLSEKELESCIKILYKINGYEGSGNYDVSTTEVNINTFAAPNESAVLMRPVTKTVAGYAGLGGPTPMGHGANGVWGRNPGWMGPHPGAGGGGGTRTPPLDGGGRAGGNGAPGVFILYY